MWLSFKDLVATVSVRWWHTTADSLGHGAALGATSALVLQMPVT